MSVSLRTRERSALTRKLDRAQKEIDRGVDTAEVIDGLLHARHRDGFTGVLRGPTLLGQRTVYIDDEPTGSWRHPSAPPPASENHERQELFTAVAAAATARVFCKTLENFAGRLGLDNLHGYVRQDDAAAFLLCTLTLLVHDDPEPARAYLQHATPPAFTSSPGLDCGSAACSYALDRDCDCRCNGRWHGSFEPYRADWNRRVAPFDWDEWLWTVQSQEIARTGRDRCPDVWLNHLEQETP